MWSYGVTLWEIYSLGETPLEGMRPIEVSCDQREAEAGRQQRGYKYVARFVANFELQNHLQVRDMLQSGERLRKPTRCPSRVYRMMKQCWLEHPEARPTFKIVHESINEVRLHVKK